MTLRCWAGVIPARWFRSGPVGQGQWAGLWRVAAIMAAGAVVISAQSLEPIADRYRKTPNATTRAAVLRYAEAHRIGKNGAADKNGALALLLLGATEDD